MLDHRAVGTLVAGFLTMSVGAAVLVVGAFVISELYVSTGTTATAEAIGTADSNGNLVLTSLDRAYYVEETGIVISCNGTVVDHTVGGNNITVTENTGATATTIKVGNQTSNSSDCDDAAVTATYDYTPAAIWDLFERILTGLQVGGTAILAIGAALTIGALIGVKGR